MIETIAVLILAASKAAPNEVAPPPPSPPPTVTAPQPPPPPGAGTFGIRAGLGGSTATPGIDIGNVGAKFLVTDSIGLSVGVGFGLTSASGYSRAAFAADGVVSFYLRARPASLRPYVPVLFGVGFSSGRTQPVSTVYEDPGGSFSLALGGGIGAEYWFSPSFSVAADLVVRLSATNFNSSLSIGINTLTPGVHATYWF